MSQWWEEGLVDEHNSSIPYTGNIDLDKRKVLREDGVYKTENSITIGVEDKQVIIPTVVDGVQLDEEAAIDHFYSTGENLGAYDTIAEADKAAQNIHLRQQARYGSEFPVKDTSGFSEGAELLMSPWENPANTFMDAVSEDPYTSDLMPKTTMRYSYGANMSGDDNHERTQAEEGFEPKIYKDTKGFLTIGIGHKLTAEDIKTGRFKGGITKADAYELYKSDSAREHGRLLRASPSLRNNPALPVTKDMAFNMGGNFIQSWPNFNQQLMSGEYQKAADNIRSTDYYKDVPNRAERNAKYLESLQNR